MVPGVGDNLPFRKDVPHPASGVGFFHDKPASSCDHGLEDSLWATRKQAWLKM